MIRLYDKQGGHIDVPEHRAQRLVDTGAWSREDPAKRKRRTKKPEPESSD